MNLLSDSSQHLCNRETREVYTYRVNRETLGNIRNEIERERNRERKRDGREID